MLRLSASSARTRRKSPARLLGLLGVPFLLVLAVAMSVSGGGAATAAAACQTIANGTGSGTVPVGTGGSGAVGQITPLQVEQYWVGAGGPMSGAVIAAAIASAESDDITDRLQGSSPSAPTTPTSGTPSDPSLIGWGLWQITPGSAADYDPTVNAKIAVEKYDGSLAAGGGGWSPWVTYTTGAYASGLAAAQAAYAQLTAQGGGGVSPGATGKAATVALTAKVTTASPTTSPAKHSPAPPTQTGTTSADTIDTSALSPRQQTEINNVAATMQNSGESGQCPNASVSGSLPTVPGQLATINPATGVASAPTGLPPTVGIVIDKLLAAGNQIHTYPYIAIHYPSMATMWPGYDCSGSTSDILYKAGLLGSSPYVSGMFDTYGQPGPGKYVTIFYNAAHVFIEVDGIVFNTAHYAPTEPSGTGPRWQPSSIIQPQINGDIAAGNGGFREVHPPGL